MKILHLISQHPESTGSGFYLQNIIRQASARGHINYLVAGVSDNQLPQLKCIERASCQFVHFAKGTTLDFSIPGMSDVMPYPSSRFSELAPRQLDDYRSTWTRHLSSVVAEFSPDLIHSNHVWLVSSLIKDAAPGVPVVTQCHATGLRQMELCPHLKYGVVLGVRRNEHFVTLHAGHAAELTRILDIPSDRVHVVGVGLCRFQLL